MSIVSPERGLVVVMAEAGQTGVEGNQTTKSIVTLLCMKRLDEMGQATRSQLFDH